MTKKIYIEINNLKINQKSVKYRKKLFLYKINFS